MAIANITAMNGKNGLIYVSGTEIYGANAWDISISHDATEYAVMNDDWKSNFSGLMGWSGSITALADQASKVLQVAAVYDGTVALLIYPDSADITTFYTGSAIFGFGASADLTSAVGRTADFTGTGALTATGFS
jgi:hypothetical protein